MTESEGTVPKCLTEDQLKTLLSEATENFGETDNPETFHALYGHTDRGIETDDVLHGLALEWQFERPPQFNKSHGQWKYYIATESIDGDQITVIITVDTLRRNFEVVTRWRKH